jgi:hypothetical protein
MKAQQEFEVVRYLILDGHISSFGDIFKYVCRSHVYKKMGINSQRFGRLIKCPSEFRLREINILAHLFKVSPMTLMVLIYGQAAEISPATMPTKPSFKVQEPVL